MTIDQGYWVVEDLIGMGWTRALIAKHLGPPDRLFPVDHWLNWSGKKAWLFSTVQLVEMTQGFEASFLHSAKIRRLSKTEITAVIDHIYDCRESLKLTQAAIEDSWTARMNACAGSASDLINEARRRGYRTPHKC